ncbi:MAG: DUF4421 domain-containing protein [Bacteroidota bacterium]|nr:DUF4421 domain-containing protein [Bacteroidota bacterium]
MLRRLIILLVSICLSTIAAFGQITVDVGEANFDTNYIESYANDLVVRVFTSKKYTQTGIIDSEIQKSLVYHPNDRTNLGFGFNYKWIGLNLGFNFGFVNDDDDVYGNSKYWDFQTQFYLRKFVIDLYIQHYTGFYLSNSSEVFENWPDDGSFYKRGDIKSYIGGVNVQYIFNYRKFSYRAAYLQNERQKKSAGSWTLGGVAYLSGSSGDSSFIPANIQYPDFFAGNQFNKSSSINFGFNGGYGHNFIIKSNFFFTVSFVAGLSLGGSSIHMIDSISETASGLAVDFTATGRIAFGYNSRRFYIGFSYVNLYIRSNSPVERMWHMYDAGKIRFNIAYRFSLRKNLGILNL